MKKICDLYHSKRTDFGDTGLLWMALILFLLGVFLGGIIIAKDIVSGLEKVDKVSLYMIVYISSLGVLLSFFSVCTYFYVYSNMKLFTPIKVLVIALYHMLCLIVALYSIIVIVIFVIINMIISYRAKKSDNYQNFLLLFIMDLMLVGIFCIIETKTGIIEIMTTCMAAYIPLRQIPIQLFVCMCVIEIVIILANKAAFAIMYNSRKKKIQQGLNKIRENMDKSFKPTDDIKEKIDDKNKAENDYKNAELEAINYDIRYQETALFKTQLFIMIAFFFCATFIDTPLFNEISADMVNVVTCFTLIILYIDKRREFGIIEK